MEAQLLILARQTVSLVLLLAGPVLICLFLVGILVSILQVATSIQDITLTFVPKILAVMLLILLGHRILLERLAEFTTQLFTNIDLYLN